MVFVAERIFYPVAIMDRGSLNLALWGLVFFIVASELPGNGGYYRLAKLFIDVVDLETDSHGNKVCKTTL